MPGDPVTAALASQSSWYHQDTGADYASGLGVTLLARVNAAQPQEQPVENWYQMGNNRSGAFFERMQASLAESERLRQQCRAAAMGSSVRELDSRQRADISLFESHVQAAKSISRFSRAATQQHANTARVMDRGAPVFLGHLSVPVPSEDLPTCLMCGNRFREDSLFCRACGHKRPEPPMPPLPGAVPPWEEDAWDGAATPSKGGTSKPPTLSQDLLDSPVRGPCSAREGPPSSAGSARPQETCATMEPWKQCPNCFNIFVEDAKFCRKCGTKRASPPPEEAVDTSAVEQNPEADEESQQESSEEEEDTDEDEELSDAESSEKWPPRPPLLRFKMRVQFSSQFKRADKIIKEANPDIKDKDHIVASNNVEIKDMIIGWVNMVFQMAVKTEFQFKSAFPIIILTMLDAIYPKRIRWREVDWKFQYKRSLQKNFALLERHWQEVNMEKAREFRVEMTHLRLENMPTATVKEQLEFLRLMKSWFDQRIHHAGTYDPAAKRQEVVDQCRTWGHHTVKFPPWIVFDDKKMNGTQSSAAQNDEYTKMPEFKRLIWFLGSTEHQTM